MDIKIIRSTKRKRTTAARLVGQTMIVNAPAGMPDDKLEKIIAGFTRRFERRRIRKELSRKEALDDICQRLNTKYFNGRITVNSIEYSTEQTRIFENCHCAAKTIRISHRLAEMPDWVRDYVIVHEMVHILHPNHSRAFWDTVARYKLAERARGYLLAKGFEINGELPV